MYLQAYCLLLYWAIWEDMFPGFALTFLQQNFLEIILKSYVGCAYWNHIFIQKVLSTSSFALNGR